MEVKNLGLPRVTARGTRSKILPLFVLACAPTLQGCINITAVSWNRLQRGTTSREVSGPERALPDKSLQMLTYPFTRWTDETIHAVKHRGFATLPIDFPLAGLISIFSWPWVAYQAIASDFVTEPFHKQSRLPANPLALPSSYVQGLHGEGHENQ